MLSKSAKKVFDAAIDNYINQKECDEERAYVYFMKFLEVFQAIKKTKDYKNDTKYYNSMVSNTENNFKLFIISDWCQLINVLLKLFSFAVWI